MWPAFEVTGLRIDILTICGHNEVMKKAKVSELKAHLSSYLAEVKRGESVIVCERATPIAQLVPFETEGNDFSVREPRRPIGDLARIRRLRLHKKVNADRLLRELRGNR